MVRKRIALVGSSGGNLFNQGGSRPEEMLEELRIQVESMGMELCAVAYVAASRSLDNVGKDVKTQLYAAADGCKLELRQEGLLSEINRTAELLDKEIAEKIRDGAVDGLILLSSDPECVNHATVIAAAERNIPVVGTGGSSMSKACAMGANVIFASGTTGTTNRIRAMTFVSAFTKTWKLKYSPVLSADATPAKKLGGVFKQAKLQGILMAALPAYIALALICALQNIMDFAALPQFAQLIRLAIPAVLGAVAARQVSGIEEAGITAGIIAGAFSSEGGTLGGLMVGVLAGAMAYYLVLAALRINMPSTTVNILAGCLAGLVCGLVGYYLLVPASQFVTGWFLWLIEWALANIPLLLGAVLGLLIWPCILKGFYHVLLLPLIFVEMGSEGFSLFGAIDMVCLVMISAGMMLANIVLPRKKEDMVLARRGFKMNLIYGTFVETAYPYMHADKVVYGGTLACASIAGAAVCFFKIRAVAYIPAPLALLLCNGETVIYLICMVSAFTLSFLFTVCVNAVRLKRGTAMKGEIA